MSATCQSVLSVIAGVIPPTDSTGCCDPSTTIVCVVEKLTQEYARVRELEETTHNQLQEVRVGCTCRLTNVCFMHIMLLIKNYLYVYTVTFFINNTAIIDTCTCYFLHCLFSFLCLFRYKKTVLVCKRPREI